MHGDGRWNNPKWWTVEDEDTCAGDICAAAREVDRATAERTQLVIDSYCLYGSFGAWGVSSSMTQPLPYGRKLSRNVIASSVDTLSSELMQIEPRALFFSAGGSWETQNRAKNLTTAADDFVESQDVDDLREQACDDGLIAGLGIMRPYIDNDEIKAERIFPTNFLIDDRTCVDVLPRTCYVRRYVDREKLMQDYPEHASTIEHAALPEDNAWVIDNAGMVDRTFDVLEVFEAWHLANGDNPGQHVIAMPNALLLREDYGCDSFPFAFFRPLKPKRGFWGESLVQRAASAQVELNKQLRRLQHIHHLTATGPIIFLQGGIPPTHITNDIGTIVPNPTGQVPHVVQLPGATPEMYAHIERLQSYVMQEFAVNEMQTQGTKPAGLSSGKALRLYTDTTSRRFLKVKRSLERMHVDLCWEYVRCQRKLAEKNPKREVLYERYGAKVRVPWSDIDVDDEHLRIKAFPVSALPQDPTARIETLEEMRKDGALDREQFWQLMPGGDFEQVRDDFVAPTELLKQRLGMILETGNYLAPEPYMNLQLGMQLAARMLQRAEIDGAPEGRLQKLRQWITDCKRYLQREQQRLSPPPAIVGPEGMPPMGPDGMPMPPPMPGDGGPMPPMGPEGMPPLPPMPPGMMPAE